jgi:hypothetical protein
MLVFGEGHLEIANGNVLLDIILTFDDGDNPEPVILAEPNQGVRRGDYEDPPAVNLNVTTAAQNWNATGQKISALEQGILRVVRVIHTFISAEPGLRVAVCPCLVLGICTCKNGKPIIAMGVVVLGLPTVGAVGPKHDGADGGGG